MKKIRFFFKKITKKYKLVFLSADSLEERFSFITNRLYVFYAFLCLFALSMSLCFVIFGLTPISAYFNDSTNTIEKGEFVNLMYYTDSLELVIDRQYQWVNNYQSIALEDVKTPNLDSIKNKELLPNIINLNYTISQTDSTLRAYVEYEDNVLNSLTFFKPTEGWVTDTFNTENGHYGVDVATNKLEKIYSVLEGRVLISGENIELGNFLIISHPENIISIYAHADSFIKNTGDNVFGGEIIGFVGNTGTLSNGTHLHFELQHNNININPEKYILF